MKLHAMTTALLLAPRAATNFRKHLYTSKSEKEQTEDGGRLLIALGPRDGVI